jgi:hypothetical protein
MRGTTSGIRSRLVVMIVSLVAFASQVAAGQGAGASIIGQVTDPSGAALPGVTVTATSPALQVPQLVTVTNTQGEYRLAPLPVGVYAIAFELADFQTTERRDLRLTVGFTAKIDVQLELATVAETVTVAGASPVVDGASTAPSTLLTKEMLEIIPTTRNGVMSLLTLTPGVRSFLDIGGSQLAEASYARAFGQGGQVWFTLDGVSTTRLSFAGGEGSFWDSQTLEEVRVQTLGTDAEAPTRGVQMSAVVKSGGNDFHGSGFFAQTGRRLQSQNLDDRLRAEGFTLGSGVDTQYDVSGDLGGRLVRNRLWFYTAARRRHQELQKFGAVKPDGSPANDIVSARYFTQKFSYQANPSHRFLFLNVWEGKRESNKQNAFRSYESREDKEVQHPVTKVEWQGIHGSSFIANLLYGRANSNSYAKFLGGAVGREDFRTGVVTGENIVNGENTVNLIDHLLGNATWYKPSWFHGNHEFKAGFSYDRNTGGRSLDEKPFNYHLLYNDGEPFEITLINAPVFPRENVNYLGTYLRDNWTVGRRLTLNVGLRYARQVGFVPAQCRDAASPPSHLMFPAACFERVDLATWNSVAPRLRAAYDVSGDGRTVVKGGWGRYDHMRQIAPDPVRLDRNSITYGIFAWRDLNRNNDYDAGEVDLDPNGPDFHFTTGMEFGDLPPRFVPNPDEKQPKVDEFSLSAERELLANVAVRVSGLYVRQKNIMRIRNNFRPYEAYNIPVTNRDPGPDGDVGTADDGGLVTYFEFAPALAGAENEELIIVTDPNATQTYRTLEVAAFKRLANRWQFMASYSATKKNLPIRRGFDTFGFSSQHEAGFYTPNDEINRADRTWDWDAKFSGSYLFPAEVLLSANFHHASGEAFARIALFEGGVTIPFIFLNAEPIGTRRLPSINLLTFRVEKSFRVRAARRLAIRLDLYNALNANTTTDLRSLSGGSFLRTSDIMFPRLAEVSASYTF